MATFLTVKEAARLTGKSPSSIRRVLYPIIENPSHPDRSHIEPSVDDVQRLRLNGENFAWRLSEDLLRREVRVDPGAEKGSGGSSTKLSGQPDADLLTMLRRELEIKNQQITQQGELIAKQMELVSGLSERLREGNILIAGLQQRLALTDGRDAPAPEPVKAKRTPAPPAEKGSKAAAKAKPKRRFLFRLFG
jgi:hypothetical protein